MLLIIDLGCGWLKFPVIEYPSARLPGDFNFKDSEVIGIDLCNYNNDVVASACCAPFRSGIADVVIMRQIVEHICPEGLIREAWRLLKPGGKCLIETPNALYVFRVLRALRGKPANPHPEHVQVFTEVELKNLLERNAFGSLKFSYYNIDVTSSNRLFSLVKKAVACVANMFFPMLDRDIRVTAVKKDVRFKEYR